MKMKKLFAGLLATSMMAAGTSAFADVVSNDAGYSKDAGTYSIASDLSSYGSDQMTIIIIPEAAYLAGTIEDADILYIDQAAADTEGIFANVGILGGTTLAEGTYYAKIGGENIAEDGIIVEKFTIAKTSEGTMYIVGDVDGDEEVTIGDVTTLINKVLNKIQKFTDANGVVLPLLAGDTDNDAGITIGDVTTAINKVLNKIEKFEKPEYELPAGVTPESTYNVG